MCDCIVSVEKGGGCCRKDNIQSSAWEEKRWITYRSSALAETSIVDGRGGTLSYALRALACGALAEGNGGASGSLAEVQRAVVELAGGREL